MVCKTQYGKGVRSAQTHLQSHCDPPLNSSRSAWVRVCVGVCVHELNPLLQAHFLSGSRHISSHAAGGEDTSLKDDTKKARKIKGKSKAHMTSFIGCC